MTMKQLLKTSIDSNLSNKSEILENVLVSKNERRTVRVGKSVLVAALVTALILSLSVFAVATTITNLSKTAALTLDVKNSYGGSAIRVGDEIIVTANASAITGLDAGIYGYTMDILYDEGYFSYVDESIAKLAGDANFKIDAHDDEAGTVTVLFYADHQDTLAAVLGTDMDLFSLKFTVDLDPEDEVDFTPFDCKIADAKSSSGFELITPTPTAESVTVVAPEAGDIDGNEVIDTVDLVLLKRHFAGKPLTAGALAAAETPFMDTTPSAADLSWIKMEMLGLNQ